MHLRDEETSRHQHQHQQQQHQQHQQHQQSQHMDDDDEGEILLQGSDYWQLDNTGSCSFIQSTLPIPTCLSLTIPTKLTTPTFTSSYPTLIYPKLP